MTVTFSAADVIREVISALVHTLAVSRVREDSVGPERQTYSAWRRNSIFIITRDTQTADRQLRLLEQIAATKPKYASLFV